jgi:hypothetical protein
VFPFLKIEYVEIETGRDNVRADLVSCVFGTDVYGETPWRLRVCEESAHKVLADYRAALALEFAEALWIGKELAKSGVYIVTDLASLSDM